MFHGCEDDKSDMDEEEEENEGDDEFDFDTKEMDHEVTFSLFKWVSCFAHTLKLVVHNWPGGYPQGCH